MGTGHFKVSAGAVGAGDSAEAPASMVGELGPATLAMVAGRGSALGLAVTLAPAVGAELAAGCVGCSSGALRRVVEPVLGLGAALSLLGVDDEGFASRIEVDATVSRGGADTF